MMSDHLGVALEYQIPDALWERTEPLLPKPKPKWKIAHAAVLFVEKVWIKGKLNEKED